ncbi:16S rRNA (guanine(527)-N(7))-methyltransferase RsmG [Nakamurella endophytica]|uniref:Ribosomal RNA small subunit methyltransferase G n=1 Tax=Nakamurella endophytica TaxID=1748367 RepID=A0A917SU52_9ACTN|nr:16S rRNA (guanine(527)-N(7))-methyltransferase RsmG [Nakamurella endophytica]GGL97347.1 hypothetical protein GCM10011594_16350 [Nakamurella endophytica]
MADPDGVPPTEPDPVLLARVFGDGAAQARRYVELLRGPGIVRGLLGPREADRLWDRHVLNSVVVQELVPAGATGVDVGSGAGLPGIPVAIARPDVRVTLVEPLERRTVFLAEVIAELGLANCRVVRGRAEQVVAEVGGADVALSRAVAPLGRLAGWCAPLLRPGGLLLALKGSSAGDEIDRDRDEVARTGLRDVEVVTVGADVVVPAVHVVRAVRDERSPAGGAKRHRRAGRGSTGDLGRGRGSGRTA